MRILCSVMIALLACLHALPACAEAAPTRPRIGLVLGGGGARGMAHLGVLQELEKLRVPIDCIAGTSAGALAGGIYATGRPLDEILARVRAADWTQILSGTPERKSLPYPAKANDYKNLADITLGLDRQGLHLPRRASGSQQIESFLRELTEDFYVQDFAQLAIPFKAIATNLLTGEARVFDRGDLAIALRASMAVPGVFDLVELDGDYLVDGMLVRNLPVEDVKNSCADIVIAVDVGNPPLKAEQINSVLDVITQTMYVATHRNVEEQRKLLGPRDILIEPDLTGYSSSSFQRSNEIIERGTVLDDATRARLKTLSLSEADYARWQAERHRRYLAMKRTGYDLVEIKPTQTIPNAIVRNTLGGDEIPKDHAGLQTRIDKLFASGEFDRVNYQLHDAGGQRVATVTPVEHRIGNDFLRLGTEVRLDTQRNSDITLLGNYQMTWLNRWGAQWRNDLRLGENSKLSSELFQPLDNSPAFVAQSFSTRYQDMPIYDTSGIRLADVSYHSTMAITDFGLTLGRFGEWRIGPFWRSARMTVDSGFGAGNSAGSHDRGLQTSLTVDQLDNPRFPRHGYYLNTSYLNASAKASSQEGGTSREFNMAADGAATFASTTLRLSLRHTDINDVGTPNYAQLGGFLQLSGLQNNQLLGEKSSFARLMAYQQIAPLTPLFGSGTYLGASLEAGRMDRQAVDHTKSPVIPAASLWLGIDTFIGPLYTGLGWSNYHGGQIAAYIYLGFIK